MQSNLPKIVKLISRNDKRLAQIISTADCFNLKPHTNYYQELVESIIGQQLSLASAGAIKGRFVAMFEGEFPTPQQIVDVSVEDLRDVGFSRAKAAYIKDLAQHIIDGRINFENIDKKTNEQVIQELTKIKGIGEWTVHMFLIFAMGRLNVLAHGDLGVRTGIKNLYGLEKLPTPAEVQAIAQQNNWAPYESVACWYIWQSLTLK